MSVWKTSPSAALRPSVTTQSGPISVPVTTVTASTSQIWSPAQKIHAMVCGWSFCVQQFCACTALIQKQVRVDQPPVFSTDIDECRETVDLCGTKTVCTNAAGTFYCSCSDGYFPTTGVIWELDVTFCKSELKHRLKVDSVVPWNALLKECNQPKEITSYQNSR